MVLVAIEQSFPEGARILDDDLAPRIMPLGYRIWIRICVRFRDWIVRKSESNVPGLWGGIMARKRYIDDTAVASSRGGAEALVNLGAGFDTRVYRLEALAGLPAWEVDQPRNITPKRTRLARIFGEVPAHVRLVPIDFDREDLAAVLASHGYPPDTRTFYIWEGVSQYLTEHGVRTTFRFLSEAPSGSRLTFTYVPRDFVEGSSLYGQEYLYKRMLVTDKIWHFGIDPETIDDFLGDYGWRTLEHLGYDELGERYVKPTGRSLRSMAIERIVLAEKA